MKRISLAKGTLEPDQQLHGWVINSDHAQIFDTGDADVDVHLAKGDRISVDGSVYKNGEIIANV